MVAPISATVITQKPADERFAISDQVAFDTVQLPASETSSQLPAKRYLDKTGENSLKLWVLHNLQTEFDFGTAFLFWPVWLGSGALTYFALSQEPRWRVILLACGFAAGLVFLARNVIVLRVLMTAWLLGNLGFALAKLETTRFSTVMMGSEVTTRITGKLIHAEEITKNRTRLIIEIVSTERPKLKFAPERIRVSARGDFADVDAGSSVSGLVKLFALPGPVQPHGYDFAFESYFDGVGAAGFFLGEPHFVPSADRATVAENIDIMRTNLTAHIRSTVPGETGAVVAALVTGVRGAVVEADNEALRRSGLAHVMSISGLHLALAAGVLIAAIRLCFAFFQTTANFWPVKKMAASAGILMAILYCLLSGSEVATVRSTIMIVVMLGAVLVDRPAITMRNLAIAALILIAVWPHEIAGPGFQMSFAATAGLIAIYRWWAKRAVVEKDHQANIIRRVYHSAKAAVVGTVLSSTVAGLATLSFGAFHFERLAPWGTLSNLLALPAISIVVMPSAVAAMVAMPFGLDGYVWPIMAFGVEFMLFLAHTIAGFGGPDATGQVPVMALLFSTMALVVFCLLQTSLKWFGLAPLLMAAILMATRDTPAMFIDESAKLVGIVTGDGNLAVSATRSGEFAANNWQRSAKAKSILKPVGVSEIAEDIELSSSFTCSKTLCAVQLPDGLRVAHIKAPESLETACKIADLVVQGYAGPPVKCGSGAKIITSGMLARGGTAALYAETGTTKGKPAKTTGRTQPLTSIKTATTWHRIEWTYPTLERPWQTQRIYSRPARDLAPKPRPAKRVFSGTGLQGRV